MTREEQLIDAYITREDPEHIIGSCENCSTLINGSIHHEIIDGNLFCDDECIAEYYTVEQIKNEFYCDHCKEPLDDHDGYILDHYGNKFCDLDHLKKYYQ